MTSRQSLFALVLAVAISFLAAPSAYAVQPDEVLPDPALETRARAISEGLRCLVCQNQSIDDSDAPLAKDLRLLVRERLKAGDSDQEIADFVVARYGEFVSSAHGFRRIPCCCGSRRRPFLPRRCSLSGSLIGGEKRPLRALRRSAPTRSAG
jgi:hypothetical protein